MEAPAGFEWDEAKAASNLTKHGVSFRAAPATFDDPSRIVFDASRAADGEARLRAVGRAEGRLMTVVFTWRGDRARIISFRPANSAEIKLYGDR